MQKTGLKAILFACLLSSTHLGAHQEDLPYGCAHQFEKRMRSTPKLDLDLPHISKPISLRIPGGRQLFWSGYGLVGKGEIKSAAILISLAPLVGFLHHGLWQPLQLVYYVKSSYSHRQLVAQLTPYQQLFRYLYDDPSSKAAEENYFKRLVAMFQDISESMLRAYLIAGDQTYLFCPSNLESGYLPPEELLQRSDFTGLYYEKFSQLIDAYPYSLSASEEAYTASPQLQELVKEVLSCDDTARPWQITRYRDEALRYLKTGECRSKENFGAPVQMRKILEHGLNEHDPLLRLTTKASPSVKI